MGKIVTNKSGTIGNFCQGNLSLGWGEDSEGEGEESEVKGGTFFSGPI